MKKSAPRASLLLFAVEDTGPARGLVLHQGGRDTVARRLE